MSTNSTDPNNVTPIAHRKRRTRVAFQPANVLICVRCDLSKPEGETWRSGEVRKRIYHAAAGIPVGVTLQLVVSPQTPTFDLNIPSDVKTQIVVETGVEAARWQEITSGGDVA